MCIEVLKEMFVEQMLNYSGPSLLSNNTVQPFTVD